MSQYAQRGVKNIGKKWGAKPNLPRSEVESALRQPALPAEESAPAFNDLTAPMTAAHRKMLETTDYEKPFTEYVSSHNGIAADKIKEWKAGLRSCTKFAHEGLSSQETGIDAATLADQDGVRPESWHSEQSVRFTYIHRAIASLNNSCKSIVKWAKDIERLEAASRGDGFSCESDRLLHQYVTLVLDEPWVESMGQAAQNHWDFNVQSRKAREEAENQSNTAAGSADTEAETSTVTDLADSEVKTDTKASQED
ncbi:hypothetical protein JCM24511_06912 [Saitozyma sp. JCM 24511]|nr:hypothetical protein JCM24511_06912 [Saitozyma sp. JCM 24511]